MSENAFAPSPELKAIILRWIKAYGEGDVAAVVNLFSKADHVQYIGTAGDENWVGETFHAGFPAYLANVSRFSVEAPVINAYENGSFGYAVCDMRLTSHGSDQTMQVRATMVFALENAVWRIIHQHNSTTDL